MLFLREDSCKKDTERMIARLTLYVNCSGQSIRQSPEGRSLLVYERQGDITEVHHVGEEHVGLLSV